MKSFPGNFKVLPDGTLEEITPELIKEATNKHSIENDVNLTGNNEEIYDENEKTQSLTPEQIKELKSKLTDEEVIDQIKSSNKNFVKKHEITQQKYIEKKQKKHLLRLSIEKASIHKLVPYFIQHRHDFAFSREDYFSQFVFSFDLCSNQSILLCEKANGLALASLLLRSEDDCKFFVADVRGAEAKRYESPKFLGIPNWKSRVKFLKKDEQIEQAFDWIGLAVDTGEKQLLNSYIGQLKSGGGVVVFTRFPETTRAITDLLFSLKVFVEVRVSDFFYRKYQVLPFRTHPTMKGNTCGGFLITAFKVDKLS